MEQKFLKRIICRHGSFPGELRVYIRHFRRRHGLAILGFLCRCALPYLSRVANVDRERTRSENLGSSSDATVNVTAVNLMPATSLSQRTKCGEAAFICLARKVGGVGF